MNRRGGRGRGIGDAKKWGGVVGGLASVELGGCVGAVQVGCNLGLAVIPFLCKLYFAIYVWILIIRK
jgi:hypothetical protein